MSTKLERAEQKLAAAKARVATLKSKKTAETRKKNTRKNIVLGAEIQKQIAQKELTLGVKNEEGGWNLIDLTDWLDLNLKRSQDRDLFSLKKIEENS